MSHGPATAPDFGALGVVLAQMARDAIAYHEECTDPEHRFMVDQYERALDMFDPDALDAEPILAAVPD